MSCPNVYDHEPGTVCGHCNLEVDQYGNTEDDFLNCCFPDCGCDGARLCMAPSGANSTSCSINFERGTTFKTEQPVPEPKKKITLHDVFKMLMSIGKEK